MSVHGHAPGGCEGSVATEASFHSRTHSFCQSSMRLLAQFHLAELKLLSGRMMQLAHRLRHTRRHMQGGPPQATPGSDVGDATCA